MALQTSDFGSLKARPSTYGAIRVALLRHFFAFPTPKEARAGATRVRGGWSLSGFGLGLDLAASSMEAAYTAEHTREAGRDGLPLLLAKRLTDAAIRRARLLKAVGGLIYAAFTADDLDGYLSDHDREAGHTVASKRRQLANEARRELERVSAALEAHLTGLEEDDAKRAAEGTVKVNLGR